MSFSPCSPGCFVTDRQKQKERMRLVIVLVVVVGVLVAVPILVLVLVLILVLVLMLVNKTNTRQVLIHLETARLATKPTRHIKQIHPNPNLTLT